MYTSVMLLALAGTAPAAEAVVSTTPSWQTSYAQAREQAAREQKPIAVVLGSGQAGYEKLGRDGGIGSEANRLLAGQYVCAYVDTATEDGRQLARAFDVPNGLGLVISDRTGQVQAFRHQGDLSNQDLVRDLTRYSDPRFMVRTTESNSYLQTSYYSGAAPTVIGSPYINYYDGGAMGGSYCPSCSGGGSSRGRR